MIKNNLQDLLLIFYKETKEEARSAGIRKANLISNSIVGITLLLLFFTAFMTHTYLLSNYAFIIIMAFFAIIMFLFFALFIIYIHYLHKVEGTHHLTGLIIEDLIFDIIYHDKEKEDIEKEIKDLFPHIRCVDKLEMYREKRFKKNIKKQKEEKILERFENKYYKH